MWNSILVWSWFCKMKVHRLFRFWMKYIKCIQIPSWREITVNHGWLFCTWCNSPCWNFIAWVIGLGNGFEDQEFGIWGAFFPKSDGKEAAKLEIVVFSVGFSLMTDGIGGKKIEPTLIQRDLVNTIENKMAWASNNLFPWGLQRELSFVVFMPLATCISLIPFLVPNFNPGHR